MAIKVTPKRISELTLAQPLAGTEELAMVQSNETRRIVLTTLRDYFDTGCQCTLISRYDRVCTGANTINTTFESYQLPGGTLANNGDWLDIYITGTTDDDSNTKNIAFAFGGSLGLGAVSDAFVGLPFWEMRIKIQRITNTTQKMTAIFTAIQGALGITNNSSEMVISSGTETLSSDITINVSGVNGTASAEQICLESFIIVHNKLDPDS